MNETHTVSDTNEPVLTDSYERYASKPEPAEWQTRDTAFAVITFVSSVFFVSLSLFGGFAAGFTVSYIVLFALTAVYLSGKGTHPQLFPLFCGASSLLISGVFALYNDPAVNFLLFAAVVCLYVVFVSQTYTKADSVLLPAARILTAVPMTNVCEPFRSYGKYYSAEKRRGPDKNIIAGLAISVPLLAVILPLLIRSDAAFEHMMGSMFSGFFETAVKIFIGAVLFVFLFAMLFSVKKQLVGAEREGSGSSFRLPAATSVTVLTVLSVFYAAYLFSQLAYFFSAFSGFLPENYSFTASEYARRGFFELCAVAGINLCVIVFCVCAARRDKSGRVPLAVRLLSLLVCLFSAVFAVTALSKMFLYIDSFGLTRLRLMTSVFMAALLLIFAGAAVYMFRPRFPVIKYAVTVLACIAVASGYCDIDRTIARCNTQWYTSEKLSEIDVNHLSGLSDSAVPYMALLLDSKDKDVREQAAEALYSRAEKLFVIEEDSIAGSRKNGSSEYNYSREKAKEIIEERFDEIISLLPEPQEEKNCLTEYF